MVEKIRPCMVVSGDKGVPGTFYGVYQQANVVGESPFIGGHKAGQISYPVAVVEYDGMLHEVNVDRVHFFEGDKP